MKHKKLKREAWAASLAQLTGPGPAADASWKATLKAELPALGHRNWIVIADSAYPAQSRNGIRTVVTGAGQVEVIRAVLEAVASAVHVRPIVYTDAELPLVAEAAAPGVEAYRAELAQALGGLPVQSLPHEEIIARLDEAARMFNVLIFKTTLALPYTSVFVQLDCGYWSAEAEQSLRAARGYTSLSNGGTPGKTDQPVP